MKLPRMSGIDALYGLRQIDPAARVVMMSGHSLVDLLAQAVDGQSYHVFYPPYQFESLRATVDGMVEVGLVLVADDSPDLADGLAQAMTEQGRRVVVARDRSTAIEKVMTGDSDLLILDIGGPILGALEIYWELKRAQRAVPTAIIVTAPGDRLRTIEKLNHFPASGYFIKPFNPLDILPAIASLLR